MSSFTRKKNIVEHVLNGVSIYFWVWMSTPCFFYDAFCLEKFGNREEITLCAFLLLQQSYLVRGWNLEIIFSLNHQAQVICQWYFLLCHWFVALTDRFKLAFQSYVIPRVWYYAATQQSINVFLVPVQYQRWNSHLNSSHILYNSLWENLTWSSDTTTFVASTSLHLKFFDSLSAFKASKNTHRSIRD